MVITKILAKYLLYKIFCLVVLEMDENNTYGISYNHILKYMP